MTFQNPWLAVALVGLLLPWLVESVLALMNLRRLGDPVPNGLEDLYDEAAYRRSQDYTRDSTRLDLIESAARLATVAAFWCCGGFPWLQGFVASVSSHPVVGGLLGLSLVYLAATLLPLPFSAYQTFVIEARYGFNRTTGQTFAADLAKSLGISALIGLPVAAVVLWLFVAVPHAWLWAWGVVTAVSATGAFLGPRLLFPLFFKFSPLEAGPLREAIEQLAARCRFPFADVAVIDGSRRSNKANAFFAGFGRTKRIALFDTLVQKLTQSEIEAVLAHEIGHAKRGHVPRMMAVGLIQTGSFLWLLDFSLRQPGFYAAFGLAQPSLWLGMVLFGLLVRLPHLLGSALVAKLSRTHEFEADAFAAAAMASPTPLDSALRKLARDHLAHLTPHPWLVALTYSHPPLGQRLAALHAAAHQ